MNWLTRGMSANVPRIAQTKPVWRYQPNARFEPCRQWIGPDKRPRCQFPGTYRGREIAKCWVGSRTGAVFRRSSLAVSPRFLWECLNSQTVNPFPAPATSHPACGFPALGAPVCLVPRVMWPIVLERLSHLTIERAGSY